MLDVTTYSSVAEMRRAIFAQGAATRADLTRALAWRGEDSADYRQLLAELAVELLVDRAEPPQTISAESADWLIEQIRRHHLSYEAEIHLLTQVMHFAVSLPSSLSSFCLAEIEAAIVSGRPGRPAGRLDAADVEALRQTLYAADENAALHVTRGEAEALFRIAHACAGKGVDPAFDELFAQAVANHLMGIAFHWSAPAEQRLKPEKFEHAPEAGVGVFLRGMIGGMKLPDETDLQSPDERDEALWRARNEADERARAEAERIDQDETIWLYAHLTRRGEMPSAERRLLAFLKQEVVNPPRGLVDIFQRVGV